ncbi:MAG TPA: glycosyltransferase [Mycobacteriales bacterium]|nr:putative glycosyltransferase [Mycobacterium sp.]
MSTVLYAIPTLGTRNCWLRLSLASVLRQTGPAVRTVVVAPTGSPAQDVAGSMGVEYLASDRPGLSAAVNDVWKTYGGDHDYLGWLADDDVLSPLSLLAAADHLDHHPGCVAVYGRMREIRSDGSTVLVARPGRLAAALLPYGTQQVPGVGGLFRADAVREAGYLDEGLSYAMDYAIFLALRRRGSLDYLPVELAAVRSHGDRITENRTDGGREITTVRESAFTARQARWYGRLTWAARAADRLYGSVLRRMPADPAPRVGGVPYVDPAAGTAR